LQKGNPLFRPAFRVIYFSFVKALKRISLETPIYKVVNAPALKNLARLLIVLEEKTGGVDYGSCKA
jgi:hypothetical protein